MSDWSDRADRSEVGPDGDIRSASWTVQHGVAVGSRTVQLSAFVRVAVVAGQAWGKVEANPARFADPLGCSLLDPRLLFPAAEMMWAAANEVTKPLRKPDDARVTRVDVARDFQGVTSPSMYVEGLGPMKRPYARRSFTYNDPARANAQTLFVGSKAGGVRLYDQHAAYADKGAQDGSLRFEVEARKGWLDKVGVTFLRDLDPVAVDRLASSRWEWSSMGQTVTGPVNAVEVLQQEVRAGRVKQATADRLLGAMVRRSFGYGEGSRTSEWRYRDVTDRLGLTVETLWNDDLSRQASGRLDFETGTEFLALSA